MSQPASVRNNSGFTLIEVMVALMIIAVGMFGVLETINVSLQHNLKNELRNEGVKLGERYMTELRGQDFDSIIDTYPALTITRKVRAGSRPFVVERSSVILAQDAVTGPTSRQLNVTVKWAFRNVTSQNRVMSVLARP